MAARQNTHRTIINQNSIFVILIFAENTKLLRHEAFFILNSINTRATVTPDSCNGSWCPYQAPGGLAFTADLQVSPYLPTVSY